VTLFSPSIRRGGPITSRSAKDLNNLIEQDHRAIKSRVGPMVGFTDFVSAQITLGGVELLHRIRQGQFALRKLGVAEKAVPDPWNAVLTAVVRTRAQATKPGSRNASWKEILRRFSGMKRTGCCSGSSGDFYAKWKPTHLPNDRPRLWPRCLVSPNPLSSRILEAPRLSRANMRT
jgi:hypothetical protein